MSKREKEKRYIYLKGVIASGAYSDKDHKEFKELRFELGKKI